MDLQLSLYDLKHFLIQFGYVILVILALYHNKKTYPKRKAKKEAREEARRIESGALKFEDQMAILKEIRKGTFDGKLPERDKDLISPEQNSDNPLLKEFKKVTGDVPLPEHEEEHISSEQHSNNPFESSNQGNPFDTDRSPKFTRSSKARTSSNISKMNKFANGVKPSKVPFIGYRFLSHLTFWLAVYIGVFNSSIAKNSTEMIIAIVVCVVSFIVSFIFAGKAYTVLVRLYNPRRNKVTTGHFVLALGSFGLALWLIPLVLNMFLTGIITAIISLLFAIKESPSIFWGVAGIIGLINLQITGYLFDNIFCRMIHLDQFVVRMGGRKPILNLEILHPKMLIKGLAVELIPISGLALIIAIKIGYLNADLSALIGTNVLYFLLTVFIVAIVVTIVGFIADYIVYKSSYEYDPQDSCFGPQNNDYDNNITNSNNNNIEKAQL